VEKLIVENFKSIRRLELECRRVNIFIGEPNTGKSNILEALGLLSFMWHEHGTGNAKRLERLSAYVRMQEPYDMLYNYDPETCISICIDGREVTGYYDKAGCLKFYLEEWGRAPAVEIWSKKVNFVGEPPPWMKAIRFYRFRPDVVFERSSWAFLAPPDGWNLPSVILLNSRLRSFVMDVLGDYGHKPLIDRFKGTMSISWDVGGMPISMPYELESDTLRRLIFFVAAMESNEGAVVTMEEPEAHAFPTYTKYLAERVARDRRNQYFITTHNPYLLLSLVEKTPVEDLAVYITYLANGETRVKLLNEDELADLMDMASAVFFNLDKLLKGLLEAPGE